MEDQQKPFIEHLADLRKCVFKSFLAWFMSFIFCYIQSNFFVGLMTSPLLKVLKGLGQDRFFIYTQLTEAFVTHIKVACYSALIVALPYIILQFWSFLRPGLKENEKKVFMTLIAAVPFFFITGLSFAYFVVIPKAFAFLLSFESHQVDYALQLQPKIADYVSFVLRMLLAFGVCFQIPVILAILAKLKLVTVTYLKSTWRVAVVLITVISAIITPPDAMSMILLALAMGVLYTLSILFVYYFERNRHA